MILSVGGRERSLQNSWRISTILVKVEQQFVEHSARSFHSTIVVPVRQEGSRSGQLVRLSKRMSQLDLCSRREADRWIALQPRTDTEKGERKVRQTDNVPTILVGGKPITSGLGQKVARSETNIKLVYSTSSQDNEAEIVDDLQTTVHGKSKNINIIWDRIQYDTVMLHKPLLYLSGQPDAESHYKLAVKLLTPSNFFLTSKQKQLDSKISAKEILSSLPFDRRQRGSRHVPPVLEGYVPAGRLDVNSSGLLIFTRNGVVAKKLVSENSKLDKEYIVKVAVKTRHLKDFEEKTDRDDRENSLRTFRRKNRASNDEEKPGTNVTITPRAFFPNLSFLKKGGQRLRDEAKPLKKVPVAEWISEDTIRFVLREGKKRQIRRMCSEILGFQVLSLERIRIGKIKVDNLPVGKWRLLSKDEVENILQTR